MIGKTKKLSEAYSGRTGVFSFDLYCWWDCVEIVRSYDYLSFWEILENSFEASKVVLSCLREEIYDWVLISMLLWKSSLFDNICTSD